MAKGHRTEFSAAEVLSRAFDSTNNNVAVALDNVSVYTSDSFQSTINSADASAATTVKSATASKSIYVTDIIISVGSAISVKLQDNTGTPVVLIQSLYLPANSVFSKSFSTPIKVVSGNRLDVIASGAGNISVFVSGFVI